MWKQFENLNRNCLCILILFTRNVLYSFRYNKLKKKLSVYTLADTLKLGLKSSDSTTMFHGLKTFGVYYPKLVTNISVKFKFCDWFVEAQTRFILWC